METERTHEQEPRRRSIVKRVWRTALAVLGIVAVVQELRRPPADRTWHGTVVGFVPYDFRMPTVERFRDTYWNPDGSLVSGKVWGVGWAPNLGALKRLLGR